MMTYFGLQCKRAVKYLPFVLLISVLMSLIFRLVLTGIIKNDLASDNKSRFKVGIVGETGDSYLNLGVTALKNLDSSRFEIDFITLSEKEAVKSLETGKIAAYVIIPKDFARKALSGDVTKITYVATTTASGLNTMLKDELLNSVSKLLVESQKGVYGLGDAMQDNDIKKAGKNMDKLALNYVDFILKRSNTNKLILTGVSDSLSLPGYFLCGIITAFVLLWGISSSALFTNRDNALFKVLKSKGYSYTGQILSEYLSYLLIMAVSLLLIGGAVIFAARGEMRLIPEFDSGINEMFVDLFIAALPAVLAVSAMQFLIYELSGGTVVAVLSQFACGLGLAFISGCLYPISFLPKILQRISAWLPSGMMRASLANSLTYTENHSNTTGLIIYFIIFISLAVIARKRKGVTA